MDVLYISVNLIENQSTKFHKNISVNEFKVLKKFFIVRLNKVPNNA